MDMKNKVKEMLNVIFVVIDVEKELFELILLLSFCELIIMITLK